MSGLISQGRLREVLQYDPASGVFTWAATGEAAPGGDSDGYRKISIEGRRYFAHRLAWFFTHGEWLDEIDHEDRNRSNNRLGNLRPATRVQQAGNTGLSSHNSSGFKGVCWDKNRGKWVAYIKIAGRMKNLGRHATKQAAATAYDDAAVAHFGEFACLNLARAA